jgi:hypothetical protein
MNAEHMVARGARLDPARIVPLPASPPSNGPWSIGSKASSCPDAASSASTSAIGVPARAESTSSSGS